MALAKSGYSILLHTEVLLQSEFFFCRFLRKKFENWVFFGCFEHFTSNFSLLSWKQCLKLTLTFGISHNRETLLHHTLDFGSHRNFFEKFFERVKKLKIRLF